MASNIIDGYGKSMIKINSLGKYYILPNPGEDGLTETNIPIYKEHILETDNEVIRGIVSFRKEFVISFVKWMTAENILQVQEILEADAGGHQLVLFPRHMNLSKSYPVFCSNSEHVLKLMKGGSRAIGMKGIVLKLTTNKTYKKIGWTSIDNLNGILETII